MGLLRKRISEFNIAERLDSLHAELSPVSLARIPVERLQKLAHSIPVSEGEVTGSDPNARMFSSLLSSCGSELSKYAANPPVKKFLDSCLDFVKESGPLMRIEEAIARLEFSGEPSFQKAVSQLRECSEKDDVDSSIVECMAGTRWIPEVAAVFDEAMSRMGKSEIDPRTGVSVSSLRTIAEAVDGDLYFFSDGAVLKTDGISLSLADEVPDQVKALAEAYSVLAECTVTDGSVRFYPNSRCSIEMSLEDRVMTLSDGGKTVVVIKDPSLMESAVKASGLIRVMEWKNLDRFATLVESADRITDIDFSTRVHDSKNRVTSTVFVVKESVFLQRVNPAMGKNYVEKVSAREALTEMRKLGYDATSVLREFLETQDEETVRLAEAEVAEIQDRLSRLGEIASGVNASPEGIDAARKYLEGRLEEAKAKLSKDDGFVKAVAQEDFGTVKKGDHVMVSAIQYTKGDEEVSYKAEDGTSGTTARSNVKP